MAYRQLGDILVAQGAVGRDDIQAALRTQQADGGKTRLGEVLVDAGKITSANLAAALAAQFDLPLCTCEKPAEHLLIDETLPFAFLIEHRILLLADGNHREGAVGIDADIHGLRATNRVAHVVERLPAARGGRQLGGRQRIDPQTINLHANHGGDNDDQKNRRSHQHLGQGEPAAEKFAAL